MLLNLEMFSNCRVITMELIRDNLALKTPNRAIAIEIGANYPEHWSRTRNACPKTPANIDLGGIIHVISSYTNDNLHLETSLHSQWLEDISGIKIS